MLEGKEKKSNEESNMIEGMKLQHGAASSGIFLNVYSITGPPKPPDKIVFHPFYSHFSCNFEARRQISL